MRPDLLKFVQQFYQAKLQAFKGASKIDEQPQSTHQLFVKDVAQAHFQGSGTRLYFNLTGPGNAYHQVTNSTTNCNPAEARRCAESAKALMEFSKSAAGAEYCDILAHDINFITPYSGQVTEIRKALYDLGIDDMWNIWTTAHSQGKQGGITIFNPVINIGKSRPGADDKVPMTLMVDKHDILVALSRARAGRMIVGDLRASPRWGFVWCNILRLESIANVV
ncbi:hypothetical protein E8E11_006683 [Didymella keratinophila]|nr:hypothetical protein E8E11_006683 [Didymella keratinophila]